MEHIMLLSSRCVIASAWRSGGVLSQASASARRGEFLRKTVPHVSFQMDKDGGTHLAEAETGALCFWL